MADLLEDAVIGIAEMPYRGAFQWVGAFANKGYRQLFVKNFTVVYRIDETKKTIWLIIKTQKRKNLFERHFV